MNKLKGVLLAGGKGTRLGALTQVVNKHLLPIYNKPLIYYSLSTLIEAGCDEICLVTNPEHVDLFNSLLGNGSKFGISIEYIVQQKPRGTADALLNAQNFLDGGPFILAYGDNVLCDPELSQTLACSIKLMENKNGVVVFGYQVNDPRPFGVVTFDTNGKIISLEEKPSKCEPMSAIIGLYVFPSDYFKFAKSICLSARGEYEITSLLERYFAANRLHHTPLSPGTKWFDTGTADQLLAAANYVAMIEKKDLTPVGSPEFSTIKRGLMPHDPAHKTRTTPKTLTA